jgi:RNA polymerase sigma-70 factor, ECF subfamily
MPPPPAPPAPEDESESADLLKRAAAGDRTAFEALYLRLAPSVMSFLHHLTGDRGLAEDATQETFAKAWRAAGRYDPARGKVRTWLFQIAKNHAWNELPRWRRARAQGGDALELEHLGATSPRADSSPRPESGAAEAAASRAETGAALLVAMDALSETLRAVFVLVRVEGRPYAEVAEVLDIPLGTVKSRLAAAETFLRERLKGLR